MTTTTDGRAAAAEPDRPPDLALVVDARALPVPLHPPIRCAVLAGRLHLAGVDPATGAGRHLVLDAGGEPMGDVSTWPLRAAALAPTAAGLIATGSLLEDGPPIVFALDRTGGIRWQHQITIDEDQVLTGFPRPVPVAADGRVTIVWVTGARNPTLSIAEVAGEALAPARTVALEGITVDLDLDGAAGNPTIVRVRGYPLRLDLLRPGVPPDRRPVDGARQPETASVAVIDGRTVVAWTSMADEAVHTQVFSPDLTPIGEPAVVAAAPKPLRLRQARLVRGGDRLAIRCEASRAVAGWSPPSDPGGPRPGRGRYERVEQFVAAYDLATGQAGPVHRVGEGGRGFDAAAWVGDRLLVIHGTREPLLSIFAALAGRSAGRG